MSAGTPNTDRDILDILSALLEKEGRIVGLAELATGLLERNKNIATETAPGTEGVVVSKTWTP